ncbi:MAG: Sua5/YciO/YrdC/YwlC family protein [Armatimonadota bacterium]|nr:Sua5/YciO/YrdC/YwlC family protein [Armatimonadota bacterium]
MHERGRPANYYGLTFQSAVDRPQEPIVILRVDPHDDAVPRRAVEVLRAGGLIVFPADDGYLVGCSALDPEAVQRLCEVTGAGREDLAYFAGSPEHAARLGAPTRPLHHPVPLALMRATGLPLAATPCRPDAAPVPSAQHAVFILGDAADLVLDAGPIRQPAPAGR